MDGHQTTETGGPVGQPGQTWTTVSIFAGFIGGFTVLAFILGGDVFEALLIAAGTFLLCLLCGTLAAIVNRLAFIEQQLERIGRELRKSE